jgi:hypothetical protein
MDQPYSMWADWLSKFHSSPELIQGLWLVAVPLTLLGITWLVMRGIGDLFRLSRGERRHWRGHLIYGVFQDGEGRWMVYWYGRAARGGLDQPAAGADRTRDGGAGRVPATEGLM